jgi:polynucleotide 5'-hydroxyl-kinase GRC3/NOL9
VVDTTGLVDRSQGGKALKQWKIELLAPSVVVSLQRNQELEEILWPLRRDGRVQTVELGVAPQVRERGREARIARRRERLAGYFAGARSQPVSLRRMAVYDLEHLADGALVAFQDGEGFALGLGAVAEVRRPEGLVVARTPLASLDGVASVRFGAARWDVAKGREV